ncbi:MAG: hypothetical protein HOB82_00445 [Alphaproteobacteria bacterium]|nr:hypothetical protein [Alphaproteobacteria bacterium]MBT4709985.1 hypothetical protein [Alphaproteobacteria bacterium]MBT5859822.1 hypothetical protein [Alphaproteobacteria bacterium]
MQIPSLNWVRRVIAATIVAAAVTVGTAFPTAAEFYTTRVLLDLEPDDQRVYVLGMIDMYEFAREDFAADPDDWLIPCMNGTTGTEVTAFFIDWLLIDPASWRFHPAKLFIEAMEEFCN